MTIPKINSAHGSDTRNILNRAIELLNRLGVDVQTLVADGQLTPSQYAQLIKEVNGLIPKGGVKLDDLSPEILEAINNSDGTPFEILSIPRDKSVSERKTTFIDMPVNLLNRATMTRFHAISNLDEGVPKASGQFHVTDFISVSPGDSITLKVSDIGHRLLMYDLSKSYIDNLFDDGTVSTFVIPDGVYYVRTNVRTTMEHSAQINYGDALAPFEEYRLPKLQGVAPGQLERESVGDRELKPQNVNIRHLDFVEYPENINLIDKNNVLENKALTAVSRGEAVDNPSNRVTDYILYEPDTYYVIDTAGGHRISFYDMDRIWFTDYYELEAPYVFKTPETPGFLRANIHRTRFEAPILNKGTTLLPYVDYKLPYFKGVTVKKDEEEVIDIKTPQLSFYLTETEDVSVGTPLDIDALSVQDWYDLYDELVSRFPDYVSMTIWGHDDEGNELRRYDFKPPTIPTSTAKIDQIFITTGTHGDEKVPIWSVYKMFRHICEDWKDHEILEIFRWNVHFVIIPLVNPSGIPTKSRKNINGVDILRNFPYSYDLGSTDPDASAYRGPAELSEKEAQCVYETFMSEDNWIYVVDYHNFFSNADPNMLIWVGGITQKVVELGQHHVRNMGGKLQKDYAWMPQDNSTFGLVNYNNTGIYYCASQTTGVNASLFETIQTVSIEPDPVAKNETSIKLGINAFVNWLYLMYLNR